MSDERKQTEEYDVESPSSYKGAGEHVEDPSGHSATTHDGLESKGGMNFVQKRHGRTDLHPLPSESPLDPLNWPQWRKNTLLGIVAFHGFMAIFSAAAIIPAYLDLAKQFNHSVTDASYFTSVQILIIGLCPPLIWAPLASRFGRRPIYLFSTIIGAAFSLGGAYCTTYGSFMATRALQAAFISPANSIGAASIREMFFSHELGRRVGVWTLMVTLAPVSAPFFCGFLVYHTSWHWVLYLLAIMQLALFFAHLFFGPETLFPHRATRDESGNEAYDDKTPAASPKASFTQAYFRFGRIDRRPFSSSEFLDPVKMMAKPAVFFPAAAYALNFAYTSILTTVLVPQFFQMKFNLNDQQIGLQFISLIIGAVLGEQVAGRGSDAYMRWRCRGREREPELRLNLSWIGFILSTVGIVIWGVQLQNATPGKWNVTPDIGSAIAAFGGQIVTTVVYSYTMEAYPTKGAAVSGAILMLRQVYGFTVPFYLATGAEKLGDATMAGICAAIAGAAVVGVVLPELFGRKWRQRDPIANHAPAAGK